MISFRSHQEKEEAKLLASLKRTPDERFQFFLKLCAQIQPFETKAATKNPNNFIIEKK